MDDATRHQVLWLTRERDAALAGFEQFRGMPGLQREAEGKAHAYTLTLTWLANYHQLGTINDLIAEARGDAPSPAPHVALICRQCRNPYYDRPEHDGLCPFCEAAAKAPR